MGKPITKLTEQDIGKTIYYIPLHAIDDPKQWERGRIKSFKNQSKLAFVVYANGNNAKIDHYDRYTAAATDYEDLTWSKP
jgi:hypothetical protein